LLVAVRHACCHQVRETIPRKPENSTAGSTRFCVKGIGAGRYAADRKAPPTAVCRAFASPILVDAGYDHRDTRAAVEAFPVDQTGQAAITTLLQTSTRRYVLAQPELDLASGAGSTVLRRER
jgi:hypothetical protein